MLESFTWGRGGQKLTPEQIERQRELVDAARGRMGDTSPVGHWTQGAARVVDALGGVMRGRRADRAESEGMASADAYVQENPVLASLVGGGQSGGGSMPMGADPIRSGLIARGLPEHVADGFVMNFQDESGLNPGINEQNPIVPGSRGGFGLAQWTGPRRKALETFAQVRGTGVDDVDTQLDFLMQELQGPESAAAQSIFAAPDAGSAAAAIVNKFLRPAEEHRARRVADYTGGQPDNGVISSLTQGMANPWVAKKYGPVMQAMMGNEMKRQNSAYDAQLRQQDPLYQAQLAKITAPEQADPWADTKVINGQVVKMTDGTPQSIADFNPQDEPEYETRQIKLPDGSEGMVERVKGSNDPWLPSQLPSGSTTGTGAPVKLTESQAKTTLFSRMQEETSPVINQIEDVWNPANMSDAVARSTPIAGNFFQSEQGQMYQSAAAAWAEGALRISTGAAATQPEIERNMKTYFAQPGDTPAVVEFKRGMREMYGRAIQASLGNEQGAPSLMLPDDFAKKYTAIQGGETVDTSAPVTRDEYKSLSNDELLKRLRSQ